LLAGHLHKDPTRATSMIWRSHWISVSDTTAPFSWLASWPLQDQALTVSWRGLEYYSGLIMKGYFSHHTVQVLKAICHRSKIQMDCKFDLFVVN
jgi:hypothetical protein